MNSNTPNQPGDGSMHPQDPHDMPGNQADPLASNPYSTRYQQSAAPDLDAGAPQLRSHDLRRMNQRALLLLGAVVLLLLFVAYLMIALLAGGLAAAFWRLVYNSPRQRMRRHYRRKREHSKR